ncbi:MAG: DUF4301 family protein [Prolixibacteraceae bacterium]|nr:DUF4301 family protein [Prolixibacteraceae bacterium]
MFSEKDKNQIKQRGSDLNVIYGQIENFKKGFPFLKVEEAASVGNGIIKLDEQKKNEAIAKYVNSIEGGTKPLKFVPASGAASRMFKSLFAAKEGLEKGRSENEILSENKEAKQFFSELKNFAFYENLKAVAGNSELTFKNALDYLLTEKGLNYGARPKGLLKFHKYEHHTRTPFEEHLVEGALYARDKNGRVNIQFTVSPEHQDYFEQLLTDVKTKYEKEFSVTFLVSFSQQKPSTDAIAVDSDNEPFRENDGSLFFRPAGHGALLENLNDLDADIIFIKNIDNVVPDKLKTPTIEYKEALAGVLLKYQDRIFKYQKELNEKHYTALSSAFLAEAANFLENALNTKPAENHYYTEKEVLYRYLQNKFNRPIRVCGMVKNEGEPGGGPFWAFNPDGTVSLQVVEGSQIDFKNDEQAKIVKHATHFNPVDLVCGVKNYKGEKFSLPDFTDPATGFISVKSKDGKELKALELPGLWNGAMSNWNTLFVEVPIETFNPVKTVNDLLREQHQ